MIGSRDVRQLNFHKQKIYLLRIFSIDPASISVKKELFSSKQHKSTRRNNSLHPGYLTSLVTRTNHNTISTNDFRGRKINNRQEISLRQCESGRVMHAGMASGLKRRFDDDDDDLSHITLRSMSKI